LNSTTSDFSGSETLLGPHIFSNDTIYPASTNKQ